MARAIRDCELSATATKIIVGVVGFAILAALNATSAIRGFDGTSQEGQWPLAVLLSCLFTTIQLILIVIMLSFLQGDGPFLQGDGHKDWPYCPVMQYAFPSPSTAERCCIVVLGIAVFVAEMLAFVVLSSIVTLALSLSITAWPILFNVSGGLVAWPIATLSSSLCWRRQHSAAEAEAEAAEDPAPEIEDDEDLEAADWSAEPGVNAIVLTISVQEAPSITELTSKKQPKVLAIDCHTMGGLQLVRLRMEPNVTQAQLHDEISRQLFLDGSATKVKIILLDSDGRRISSTSKSKLIPSTSASKLAQIPRANGNLFHAPVANIVGAKTLDS